MASLAEILKDPNYTNANQATKEAIFNKYSADDTNYTGANEATKAAIRDRFGVNATEEEKPKEESIKAPVVEAKAKPEIAEPTFGEKYNPLTAFGSDLGLSVAKGTVGLPKVATGLESIGQAAFNTNPSQFIAQNPLLALAEAAFNKASGQSISERRKLIADTINPMQDYLQSMKSKAGQYSEQEVQKAEGFIDTMKALATHPRALMNIGAESLPAMYVGAKGAGALESTLGTAASLGVGEGVQSMGNTAAGITEAQGNKDLTPTQAALATGSGALTGMFGAVGNKAAHMIGATDFQEMMMNGFKSAEAKSVLVNALKSALVEGGVEEAPQDAQEQIANNLATGRPWYEGVAEAMAQGFMVALPLGGMGGAYEQYKGNQFVQGKKDQEEYLKNEAEREKVQAKKNAKIDMQGMTDQEKENYKLQQAGKTVPKTAAELEAENYVTGTNDGAGGASANIPGQPINQESNTGAGEPIGGTVAGAGSNVGAAQKGEIPQPATLEIPANASPELTAKIEEYNTRQQQIATSDNKFKANAQIKKNETLLKEIQTMSVAPAQQAAPVQEEVKPTPAFSEEELKAQEDLGQPAKVEEAPAEEAKAEPVLDKAAIAKNKMADALARAAEKATKLGRTNIVPEQDEDWHVILRDLFSATADMGIIKFEDAVEFVKTQLKNAGINVGLFKPEQYLAAHDNATAGLRAQAKQEQESQLEAQRAEAQAAEPRRAEVLDQKEVERIERAYPVKSVAAADVGDEEIAGYEANRGRQAEELAPAKEGEEVPESELLTEELPAWGKLNNAEKVVYNTTNKTQGPDAAVKALRDFRTNTDSNVEAPKDPNAALYEVNRDAASKEHNIKMPRWQELSPKAQSAFLSDLPKLGAQNPTHSGAALHTAFQKVASQLEQEGIAFRGVHHGDVEQAKLDLQSAETQRVKQAESAKEKARAAEAAGKGVKLPENVVEALETKGVNGVLDYIAYSGKGLDLKVKKEISGAFNLLRSIHEKASQQIFKALARTLSKVDFQSKIVTDPGDLTVMRLQQEGKLAEYDPKTDTFYFTPEGMDEATILHEVLHAATVKIINQFNTSPETLTQNQRDAVEHLNKLYEFAKNRLGNKYPNATENVYEFVSYAMTDFGFQNELAKLQVPRLGKYTLREDLGNLVKSAWGQFTTALSQMYNLVKATPTGLKLYDEVYTGVAKDFATVKGSLEELYKDVTDEDLAFEEANYEETEPKAPAKFMAAKRLLSVEKGFENNILLEVAEVMNRILAAPEVGTNVEPLAAKKAAPVSPTTNRTLKERFDEKSQDLIRKSASSTAIAVKAIYGAVKNPRIVYRAAVRAFESNAQPLKLLQRQLELSKTIIRDKSKQFNNTYELLMGAAARSNMIYMQEFGNYEEVLKDKLAELKKKSGLSTEKMFSDLQLYLTGLHEPERRRWFFMRDVPLRHDIKVNIAGILDTPANHRERLMNALEHLTDSPGMTAKEKSQKIRDHLNKLIFSKVGDLNAATAGKRAGTLNKNTVDFTHKIAKPHLFDENNDKNNVVGGYKVQDIDDYRAMLDSLPYKDTVYQILKIMKAIQDETINLNLHSNFYTQSNVNYINMTSYDWYVPFKGRPEETKAETEMFRNNDTRYSGDLQFWDPVAKGRESLANNPVAQTMVDAKKAAYILSHQPVTESVVNNIKQGNIKGKLEKTISQEEKYKIATKQEAGKTNTIFHHLPNGKIQVWKVDDPNMLGALRRPYKTIKNPAYRWGFNAVANVTRVIGQGFTRFNPAFPPANAVKDIIPNLFYISQKYGAVAGAKFLVNVINTATADTVMGGGVFSAGTAMHYLQTKNYKALEDKAKTDNFTKLFLELANQGGIVSFLQGVSTPREQKILADSIKSGKLEALGHAVTVLFDYWMHMSEVGVRVSVYKTVKDYLMNTGKTEAEAIQEAAQFAKEVSNFEHSGVHGKGLATLYTFARATATGVVRYFDDLSYALPMALDSAVKDLPASIADDPKAKAEFIKNFKVQQLRSRVITAAYIGMGYFAYMAALSGSEDDDKDRNIIAGDDPALWTRGMRFTIPGTKYMFQVPTGYGPGSLIALGQQMGILSQGNQTPREFLSNIATITQDSFMPFPVSRIPITDHPIASITDTLSPSIIKPVIEYALLNMNGLGMQIVQDQGNNPQAYTSSGTVPEIYKETAKWLSDHSDHTIDISPNALYFLASNYVNGFNLIAKNLNNLTVIADGEKEYDIGTDNPLVSGFVGRKPTPDSREYNRIRTLVEQKQKAMKAAGETSFESIAMYKSRHPNDARLIDRFEQDAVTLNDLNHARRVIDANQQGYSPKEKQRLMDANKAQIETKKYALNMYYKQIAEDLKTVKDKD